MPEENKIVSQIRDDGIYLYLTFKHDDIATIEKVMIPMMQYYLSSAKERAAFAWSAYDPWWDISQLSSH